MNEHPVATSLRAAPSPRVIPFLVGGAPSPAAFEAALLALADAGAPVIEIGIPFSDPIADGPVIAQAMHEVLGQGSTARGVLAHVRSIRPRCPARLVAMVSASILARLDPTDPALPFSQAGFDGLIVPDLDPAEASTVAASAGALGLAFIPLVAPTTEPSRAASLAGLATGFAYAIARRGITGGTGPSGLDVATISSSVSRLRDATAAPVAIGFGLSTAEDVAIANDVADAAIVGTPFVKVAGSGGDVVALYRSLRQR